MVPHRVLSVPTFSKAQTDQNAGNHGDQHLYGKFIIVIYSLHDNYPFFLLINRSIIYYKTYKFNLKFTIYCNCSVSFFYCHDIKKSNSQ